MKAFIALETICVLVLSSALAGCRHGSRNRVIVVNPPSSVAGDFQSIADYLANFTVQNILDHMPRHRGGTAPFVEGDYESAGFLRRTTIPGTSRGDPVAADFCFGPASGSELEVIVQDPSVVDAGARSFIEGDNDSFTVYTAFKSVQTLESGGTCEIHEVNVFSGIRNPDGSISDLFIGVGIVGLVGACDFLLVGDFQVSENTADRVGDACVGGQPPGTGPIDPANVLVSVENNLVVDLLVFLDDDLTPTIQVDPLSVDAFETPPGFAVYFESLQPIAGQDGLGQDLLMGEIVSGQFSEDPAGAGESVTYTIENQVGNEIYFAPLPLNRSSFDIFSVVNRDVPIPGYPDPPGSGLDCLCSMPPSLDPYVVGYYSYARPGIIAADEANVGFFRVSNEQGLGAFQGPFDLDGVSGTVTLLVQ
ncbi:MAG TPA: hypothetical protein VMT52_02770 [Planctomycetota bacterium]|nr:hypothetical protein [Planctomycetota bacterium]